LQLRYRFIIVGPSLHELPVSGEPCFASVLEGKVIFAVVFSSNHGVHAAV
jgi:hypothetical protein